MSSRKQKFVEGEFYHLYNRGIDGRDIVKDKEDSDRFIHSLITFNSLEPVGSIYEHSFVKDKKEKDTEETLVDVYCYCLNPNHYHLLVSPKVEEGVEQYMQRVGTGYTKYFNNKYKRRGSLFQGKFQSVHVNNDVQFQYLQAYITLNYKVHKLGSKASKFVRSSEEEYRWGKKGVCNLLAARKLLGPLPSVMETYYDFLEELQESKERMKDVQAFE